MDIKIRGVHKHYGSFHALRGIDLDIASGELLALLGPSGSGKTTLLRAIAGLEPLDEGQVLFGGEGPRLARVARSGTEGPAVDGRAAANRVDPFRQGRPDQNWIDATRISVQQRRVGFVFQQYALFKHMTVFDNVAFGLSVRPKSERPCKAAIAGRVGELLELVQLGGLEQRYPAQLSGGQKQRVALARALAIEPRVLLLDEPFGALDAKVRKDLRRWLRKLHRETGTTMVFVTHDQEEALELADRVVVMNRGRIEQIGTTDQVYDFPGTPFVFDFLGSPNILRGTVRQGRVYLEGASAPLDSYAGSLVGDVEIHARPADFRVVHFDPAGIDGHIVEVQRTGALIRLGIEPDARGATIEIEIPHPDPEMKVWDGGDPISVRPAHFSVFAPGAGCSGPPPGFDRQKTPAETRVRDRA